MAIKGEIIFPGDKSISHRALMFAALANGESRISNLSTGVDVKSTRNCLEACGIEIGNEGNEVVVNGGKFSDPTRPLDCGNSGTTTRLLLGLLAGQGINATFVGDESLSSRPMNRILDPLFQMGLKCESHDGKLPITIQNSDLNGIQYESPVASAQVKSAILLAGLGASGKTSVKEPILSRDHTEKMINGLGVDISIKGLTATVSNLSTPFSSFQFSVPGDPSTAAFFAASAALVPNSEIVLNRVLANPTRIGFFAALEKMGVGIEWLDQWDEAGERIRNIKIFHQALNSTPITIDNIPGLIDEIPVIAILATQVEGKMEIRGAEELRIKECDRIHAICKNLKTMGADIQELDDGFIINGPTPLYGAKIETFHDHRIAMAFAIAGLVAHGKMVLDHPECASISYPEFYDELERMIQ
ncbi:MAG: 3-phosphoshikimate 1-carboxyvinyltransferase [Candidatus Marinimicrobia bacterium]|jgi:3-phosphoshikimate 1-carboxyvinyltransferase|nr:3-phosphoshikimate 1-carboxyvinyltransferase [Candidatus Neomarinimicrobiota bacterium]MCS5645598.1 3-phosphoshikimate 1-carboxyvinyltransferase [Candidatus Neomarinimicrobiota bacterium]MEC7746470.1 3-phosphoshikimate 1-carboxyvinyltransferase [Candidatus Neomarinimicrobiota bacterium]MEC7850537.1 3-phosphoshikimate 1-carboxyvinyltransferase [Candidatus Neomarinimicrobiota bacterium]MEC8914687.1 3-phosphoshikimate 1-carboxyvinyltransferase [Candidatus Neomarinimicrobiota bacterium]|tara:strand:- start:4013 stop:5260 length:1248 start_codon:yes stop_codon:yes gene_type:complete